MIGTDVLQPLFLVVLAVVLLYLRLVRGRRVGWLICIAAFAAYLFKVVDYAFLPLRFDLTSIEALRGGSSPWSQIQPVPLLLSPDGGTWTGRQYIGNLLLGVPFGFGLPFVVRVRPRVVLLSGFLLFLGVELAQLLLDLVYGFAYRTVDVNDLILNTTGVGIGMGLLRLARGLYAGLGLHVEPTQEPWGHLHEVLMASSRRPQQGDAAKPSGGESSLGPS